MQHRSTVYSRRRFGRSQPRRSESEGTALCVAVVLTMRTSGLTLGAFLLAAVIVAGAGYVYERTENLLAPMVAYGLAAVLGAIFVLLPIVTSFYATFGVRLP